MQHDFTHNFQYQAQLLDQVKDILKANAGLFLVFDLANDEQDMKQATDMVLTVKGGQRIAVRIRREQARKYTDVTIRARSKHGAKTEIDKLREGWGDWYVYAWESNQRGRLDRWCIYDLHAVRRSGLLEKAGAVTWNGDGTGFVTISLRDLFLCGALIAWGGMRPSEQTLKLAQAKEGAA